MRLVELFQPEPLDIVSGLRQRVLNLLTPFVANKVPCVSVQQIIDKMQSIKTGITVDRALVMHVLDPMQVKVVKKIEGDLIYLSLPEEKNEESPDEAQKNKDKVDHAATKQATKDLKSSKTTDKMASKASEAPPPIK